MVLFIYFFAFLFFFFWFFSVELVCLLCDSGLHFAYRCIGCSELTSGVNGCLCYMLALR